MNPNVDNYLNKLKNWKKEAILLRSILLECGLTEDFKWGRPCYTFDGKNLIGLTPLKEHCALNIFQGAKLNDPNGLLTIPGENTQSARWMKFSSEAEIVKNKKHLKSFIKDSIAFSKIASSSEKKSETPSINMPEEFVAILKKNTSLKKAFNDLTPGRQRGYLIYFTGTKNSQTIINRIEKYIPKILCGKGLNDCTCGLSKKLPSCDGSHKFAKT